MNTKGYRHPDLSVDKVIFKMWYFQFINSDLKKLLRCKFKIISFTIPWYLSVGFRRKSLWNVYNLHGNYRKTQITNSKCFIRNVPNRKQNQYCSCKSNQFLPIKKCSRKIICRGTNYCFWTPLSSIYSTSRQSPTASHVQ